MPEAQDVDVARGRAAEIWLTLQPENSEPPTEPPDVVPVIAELEPPTTATVVGAPTSTSAPPPVSTTKSLSRGRMPEERPQEAGR